MTKNNKMLDIIDKINNIKKTDSASVTFFNHDGTKRHLSLNKYIFFDDNNKKLKPRKVMQNLNELKHDLHAKYFRLNVNS